MYGYGLLVESPLIVSLEWQAVAIAKPASGVKVWGGGKRDEYGLLVDSPFMVELEGQALVI